MGVDYSTTIGYGIVVNEDSLPKVLLEYADGDWFGEEEGVAFLQAHGLDQIAYDKVGNWMSGPTYVFFHLPRTRTHGNEYELDGIHKFNNIDLSNEESSQFVRLRNLLNMGEDGQPTWIVSFNVS